MVVSYAGSTPPVPTRPLPAHLRDNVRDCLAWVDAEEAPAAADPTAAGPASDRGAPRPHPPHPPPLPPPRRLADAKPLPPRHPLRMAPEAELNVFAADTAPLVARERPVGPCGVRVFPALRSAIFEGRGWCALAAARSAGAPVVEPTATATNAAGGAGVNASRQKRPAAAAAATTTHGSIAAADVVSAATAAFCATSGAETADYPPGSGRRPCAARWGWLAREHALDCAAAEAAARGRAVRARVAARQRRDAAERRLLEQRFAAHRAAEAAEAAAVARLRIPQPVPPSCATRRPATAPRARLNEALKRQIAHMAEVFNL